MLPSCPQRLTSCLLKPLRLLQQELEDVNLAGPLPIRLWSTITNAISCQRFDAVCFTCRHVAALTGFLYYIYNADSFSSVMTTWRLHVHSCDPVSLWAKWKVDSRSVLIRHSLIMWMSHTIIMTDSYNRCADCRITQLYWTDDAEPCALQLRWYTSKQLRPRGVLRLKLSEPVCQDLEVSLHVLPPGNSFMQFMDEAGCWQAG